MSDLAFESSEEGRGGGVGRRMDSFEEGMGMMGNDCERVAEAGTIELCFRPLSSSLGTVNCAYAIPLEYFAACLSFYRHQRDLHQIYTQIGQT